MNKKYKNIDPEIIPIADYCTKHELALRLLYAEQADESDEPLMPFIEHCLYFFHHAQDVIEIYEKEKIPELIERYNKETDFNMN